MGAPTSAAKPSRQLAYRGSQPSSRLRLRVRGPADLGQHRDRRPHRRDAPRATLGSAVAARAGLLGQIGKPLARRRRLVVDDVVDAGRAVARARPPRRRRVRVWKHDHIPAAVADDRERPLRTSSIQRVIPVSGAVQAARSGARRPRAWRTEHRRSSALIAAIDSFVARSGWRSSGSLLGLDRAALADVRPARIALRRSGAWRRSPAAARIRMVACRVRSCVRWSRTSGRSGAGRPCRRAPSSAWMIASGSRAARPPRSSRAVEPVRFRRLAAEPGRTSSAPSG